MSTHLQQEAEPGLLLIAPHGSYRTGPFLQAARELGVQVQVASQGQHSIVSDYARGIHIDFSDEDGALDILSHAIAKRPVHAVLGTDDMTTELAARLAERHGLPHNPVSAVRVARRKDLARDALQAAGVRKPAHARLDRRHAIDSQLPAFSFPMVIKPVALSASRGVIRANNRLELEQAVERVGRILDGESSLTGEERHSLLIEQFIPGQELAVEAMLYAGQLQILAIFDKPDPLDGPFFEETIYITPSSQPDDVQQALFTTLQAACEAYGLREGPIHAECRVNSDGVWILEVAARTIGGLCGRLLQLGTGYSLEQLVILHALGQKPGLSPMEQVAGVLMLPVPGAGVLKRIEGLGEAQKIPFVEEVNIQVREGYEMVPLPEGSSYPGFVFARAPSVAEVDEALRQAQAKIRFILAPLWKARVA